MTTLLSTFSQSQLSPQSPITSTIFAPIGTVNTPRIPIVNNVAIISANQIDSGLHDNPMAQMQILDYIHYKFLDKWLYNDFPKLLKYLKVNNDGVVRVVKNKNEYKNNNVDDDSKKINQRKSDFIEDEFLSKNKTRKVLIKLINENSIKWYELPHNETLVKHAIRHYIKKELKKRLQN